MEDSPAKHKSEEILPEVVKTGIFEIPLDQIQVNPFQPRVHFDKDALSELSESIKVQGIIQPITVRKLDTNEYQLISGERRFQASKLAGLAQIPAYVRTANDQQMLEMALIENIQRENLNALEIAHSYQRLLAECDLKQEQLGDRVGKNRTTVNNYLRLLKLPPTIQAAIRDQQISMGHARALINIEDVDKQLAIFKKAVEEELSVRKVEALVKALNEGKPEKKSAPELDPVKKYEISKIQQRLASHFGTKVSLKSNDKNKGEIKIPFTSTSDLNRILEILEII
ncbi:ParB/RepB/Spo0J family partition protein [Algoriphagus halophilus]